MRHCYYQSLAWHCLLLWLSCVLVACRLDSSRMALEGVDNEPTIQGVGRGVADDDDVFDPIVLPSAQQAPSRHPIVGVTRPALVGLHSLIEPCMPSPRNDSVGTLECSTYGGPTVDRR